jgi:hypothetical protein
MFNIVVIQYTKTHLGPRCLSNTYAQIHALLAIWKDWYEINLALFYLWGLSLSTLPSEVED